MKVYSWKTLLTTIVVGGSWLVYSVYEVSQGNFAACVQAVMCIWLMLKGLQVALVEEEYKKDVERADKGKQIYRKRFGKFAPIAPYVSTIAFIIAAVLVYVLPNQIWLALFFLFAGLIYLFWLNRIVRKEMNEENENSNQQ